MGRSEGHLHWSSDETHVESQHCSWPDGHEPHMSKDGAQAPVPGQVMGMVSGQDGKHAPVALAKQRRFVKRQAVALVMRLHGVSMHFDEVQLYQQLRTVAVKHGSAAV